VTLKIPAGVEHRDQPQPVEEGFRKRV